jgi:hypothetical protein
MKLNRLFGRETWVALDATIPRLAATSGGPLILVAVGFLFPSLLPWWGWTIVGAGVLFGLALLGSHWADKDLDRRLQRDDEDGT